MRELEKTIPRGKWHCERCYTLIRNKGKLTPVDCKCYFCHGVVGIIFYVMGPANNKMWVHVECVNWIPELYFKDDKRKKLMGSLNEDRM